MEKLGLAVPESGVAGSLDEAREIVKRTGFPAIIRPSFTLGGSGGSIAWKPEEYDELVEWALQTSPKHTCLI
jgi:carbamoyl-phosphate synthase large subunit